MRSILILIFMVVSQTLAGVQVKVNEVVNNYVQKHELTNEAPHRSGLLNADKSIKQKDIVNEPIIEDDTIFSDSKVLEKWKAPMVTEYSVIESTPSEPEMQLLSKKCQLVGSTNLKFDSSEHMIIIESPNDSIQFKLKDLNKKESPLNKEQLKQSAEKFAKSALSKYWNYIEYDRTDLTIKNDSVIVSADINFRRVFRGGIILDNISFINISLNAYGNVTSIKIKWPRFKQINNTKLAISLPNALNYAKIDYTETSKAENGEELATVLDFEIKSVAQVWHQIVNNGALRISPCYSFKSTAVLDNGQTADDILDVPICKSYFINNTK